VPYKLKIPETDCFGVGKFQNDKGNTECAVFVQQATGAPQTSQWGEGDQVKGAKPGTMARGTAIATFDDNGKYPTDGLGKHAAVYLSHDDHGITVLDQWNSQGQVLQRVIRFGHKGSRSNNGDTFYVIK